MKLLAKAAATNGYIAQALGDLKEDVQSTKRTGEDTNRAVKALTASQKADATSIRQQNQGYNEMNIQEHEKRKEENAQIKRMIEKEAEKNERREQEQKDRDANRDRELEVVRTLLETPAGKKMLAELGDNEESEVGAGMKPTTLFGDDGNDSSFETDAKGKVVGVATTASVDDKDREIARLELENMTLRKENADLLTPDDHQTLKERAKNAKHVDPTAVGRTAASVKKHIKDAKSARKGKKQAEHVRREGLRSRTRSQTNSRA